MTSIATRVRRQIRPVKRDRVDLKALGSVDYSRTFGLSCPPPAGETSCSTPAVANSLIPSGEAVRAGDSLNLTCSQGFQLDGARQITCGPDGQWRPPPPRCLRAYVPTQIPVEECEFALPQVGFFYFAG